MAHKIEQGLFGITPHTTTFSAAVESCGLTFKGRVVGLEREPEELRDPKDQRRGIVVKTEEENGINKPIRNSYPLEDFLSGQCGIARIEYYPDGESERPDPPSLTGFSRVDTLASILRANR